MQEVHVACPCCKNKRLFDADPEAVEGIIKIKVEAVCLDSTTVKVHPNGTGALKKAGNSQSDVPEEDSPRKFIWSPHLTDRLSASLYPEEKHTTRRRG